MLTITLKRHKDGRLHVTRLKEHAIMHHDILDKLIDKCTRRGVTPEQIEGLINSITNTD